MKNKLLPYNQRLYSQNLDITSYVCFGGNKMYLCDKYGHIKEQYASIINKQDVQLYLYQSTVFNKNVYCSDESNIYVYHQGNLIVQLLKLFPQKLNKFCIATCLNSVYIIDAQHNMYRYDQINYLFQQQQCIFDDKIYNFIKNNSKDIEQQPITSTYDVNQYNTEILSHYSVFNFYCCYFKVNISQNNGEFIQQETKNDLKEQTIQQEYFIIILQQINLKPSVCFKIQSKSVIFIQTFILFDDTQQGTMLYDILLNQVININNYLDFILNGNNYDIGIFGLQLYKMYLKFFLGEDQHLKWVELFGMLSNLSLDQTSWDGI